MDARVDELPTEPFVVHSTLGYTDFTADPASLWPPNGKMLDVSLSCDVSEAAVGDPDIAVTCNESGFDAARDFEIVDSHHIRLRAERGGKSKEGRVYTITLTLADAEGNEASYETAVTVPHDQGRKTGQVTSAVATQTANGAQIVYSLSADASVSAEVLNIAGRVVKRICTDAPAAVGANTLLWDGVSAAGTRVPNGRYIVRIIARSEDGQQSQAVAILMLRH